MPAQRLELRPLYSLLESRRVAILDGRTFILEYATARRMQLSAALENCDRGGGERKPETACTLHLRVRHPRAACLEIDAVPRELKHRAHAKAGEHCKLSRQLQVRR